ncbi:MAG: dTDP-4-dehydrorhamnose 3,5-epimerase [Proteobacteria bacterium]|nr:dTDP-4-dehydrorhamnose 3,5-epimerase [Pseudomonadota bacterium]
MKVTASSIPEILLFEPTVHGDDRGYFMETWRQSVFEQQHLDVEFVQDNQSKSSRGTLRGLHYQLQYPQGKLARVVSGEIFDVAVDLRRSSAHFGKWVGAILSAENNKQLWVPPGFAHGFYVISESAVMLYKCTEYYHPEDDYSLLWNDAGLAINWPLLDSNPQLSEKDRNANSLTEALVYP